MLLYEKMKERLNALALINEPLPLSYSMNFNMLWLGHLTGDTFEIIIRDNAKDLGWLYADAALVFFTYSPEEGQKEIHYECWLSVLKELVELKLKDKVFADSSEAGTLRKEEVTKRVLGYLDIKDVLAISGKLK
jgi:hypothetical protein